MTALPEARFRDEDQSMKIGVSAGVPKVAPVSEAGAKVDVEGQTGSGSWRRRVSPRHREAVKQFFGGDER